MATTQTFNISFPKKLVEQIDKVAEEQFASRSDFLRTAAIEYIKRQQEWEYIFREGQTIGGKAQKLSEAELAELVTRKRRHSRRWAEA